MRLLLSFTLLLWEVALPLRALGGGPSSAALFLPAAGAGPTSEAGSRGVPGGAVVPLADAGCSQ